MMVISSTEELVGAYDNVTVTVLVEVAVSVVMDRVSGPGTSGV